MRYGTTRQLYVGILAAISLFTPFNVLMASDASSGNPENQQLYRSAAFLGRGDTGIADADNEDAIFYNPAGLAQGKGIFKRVVIAAPHVEISSQTRDIYQRLQVQGDNQVDVLKDQIGKPLHVGLGSMSALVFRRAALGGVFNSNANLLVRKDPEQGGLETVDADFVSNQIVTFSLAESYFSEQLCIGATAKYLSRNQAGFSANIIDAQDVTSISDGDLLRSGRGTGFDLGFLFKTGKSVRLTEQAVGLTVSDIGNTNLKATEDGKTAPSEIEQAVNLGYVLSFGTKFSRMKLLADVRDVTGVYEPNIFKRLHFGSELNVAHAVGVMGGVNQGYPTAGAYLDLRFFRIDLGYYTQERGELVGSYPDQRYYLRLMVGL